MVIDTSAILAILLKEPEQAHFLEAIERDKMRLVSTASVLELFIVSYASRQESGIRDVELFLHKGNFEKISFDDVQLLHAMQAFSRYGKGRHPARLNFGDCFSYALAKTTGEPLLFKGNNFTHTDIKPAIS